MSRAVWFCSMAITAILSVWKQTRESHQLLAQMSAVTTMGKTSFTEMSTSTHRGGHVIWNQW